MERDDLPPCAAEQAASRRFPIKANLISELVSSSESFRELCEDLAEAERALTATEQMSGTVRSVRRAECHEWIEGLTNEIERTLREVKGIPLQTRTKGNR